VALSATTAASTEAVGSEKEEIPPEILAAIAAAATAFLGTKLRLLSVSHIPQVSRWTRLGRASVQASHNLRTKR
jgi:hypothetical protein